MGAREDLALGLSANLPTDVWVIEKPRKLEALDAAVVGVVMLVRTEIEKAGNPGTYKQDFEVWVIEPSDDEDHLDDITDAVIEAIDTLDWGTWTKATRSRFDDTYPAYRIDMWVATTSVTPAAPTLEKEN